MVHTSPKCVQPFCIEPIGTCRVEANLDFRFFAIHTARNSPVFRVVLVVSIFRFFKEFGGGFLVLKLFPINRHIHVYWGETGCSQLKNLFDMRKQQRGLWGKGGGCRYSYDRKLP